MLQQTKTGVPHLVSATDIERRPPEQEQAPISQQHCGHGTSSNFAADTSIKNYTAGTPKTVPG